VQTVPGLRHAAIQLATLIELRRPTVDTLEMMAKKYYNQPELVERYPLAPLVRLAELHAGRTLPVSEQLLQFGQNPSNRNAIYRARAHGLDAQQADRWAIAAGFHPALVWGLDWFHGGAA
jgi:hypothetical protein